jgi:hypothetical protein
MGKPNAKIDDKPEYEEWLYWAQAVIDRLATAIQVYSKPPYESLMPDKLRQERNAQLIDLLQRFEALTDGGASPSDSLAELDHHGERVIDGLAILFAETLQKLPELSGDMQKLLKSNWRDKCNGRLANELFRGPMGNEAEGIGSGHPRDKRLPEVLQNLLAREETGTSRQPRALLEGKAHEGHEPRRDDDVARRWGERNSRILRSAGRVE